MTTKTCRDCGNVLEQTARGCPRCACNIEAEDMIERFIWFRFMPALIVIALVVAALIYFLV
ncbi:MAG TPA: hypothetical protein VIX17_11025 [Pyrinomonadaceae bacterium]|jgi:hypothetical protein